ncbi:MAG: VWA domain-containing protein [Candidatus Neomarinimicrobiota bacterium]
MFYFANWGYLLLLLLLPVISIWYWKIGRKQQGALRYASVKHLQQVNNRRALSKIYGLLGAKLLGIALLIIALARPQSGNTLREFTTEGIDIMLVLDISSSMRAIDFRPNRLEAAKSVAREFIEGRQNDRIGLVVFAAESFLQCPLTIDYGVLKDLLTQVDIIEEKYDGTAIGMAIANATNRLRDSKAKSKIMILLSDGRNNAGEIDPRTAARLAAAFDVKIYTIGAGKLGQAPYPVALPGGQVQYRLMDVEIDEALLNDIASQTGGRYFRATDEKSLATIYEEISGMEKTEVKVREFVNYNDLYDYFLIPGFLLIALSGLLGLTVWRRTP